MYQEELDRLHKAVDEKSLTGLCKENLHDLIDSYFRNDYQGISKDYAIEITERFRLDLLKCGLNTAKKDLQRGHYDQITNKIKVSFFTIIETSVDKTSKTERILKSIPSINVNLFKR